MIALLLVQLHLLILVEKPLKIKEEYLLDSEGRRRLYNFYICDSCNTEYKKQKRLTQNAKYEHFCSIKCGTISNINNTYLTLQCATCNITFNRLKSKLSLSKHNVYFCSRKCKDIGQTFIKSIQPAHYGSGETHYRDKALRNFPNKCFCCGYNNVHALEVHHIDKNRSNNKLENLIILCANCHTLVHKNKLQLLGL